MNWNAKLKSVTLPPVYPKTQPAFLEPNIINTPSQVPLNSPRSNHPACMFPSNSNPVSQSALNIRNTAPQQISPSDIHNRTIFPSQALVERNTYVNVKGPNHLNNSLQMSPEVAQNVWTNSSVSNSMFSHTGAAVTQPNSFRTNLPNVIALQNQFVSSEIYPRQGQMAPSNSVRVPVTYQGNQRLTSSFSERQADWAQQYTSNGLTYADYRPHSEQYNYPSQSFLQSPALQKQNPMPLTSVQVKNSHPSNSALTLQSKQTAPLSSNQIAVLQTEKILPTPYDCRYVSQTLQNTQHVITHSSSDVPQGQEAHISEIRKEFCRGFQQQNLNENESMIGNFCNVKVNTNNNQPYNDNTSSSVDAVQILPQSNQEERVEFCNLTSSQVPDTSLTKEKLVKDIEKLVEMRNKFYELARKVKIDKNILMSSGCIKANSESTQNSELALKQNGKIQVTPFTPEIVDKSPTAVEIEKSNRMHSRLNSNIQDTNLRNSHQVNSILLNSVCSGKGPVSDQLHNIKDGTSFKIPAMEQTQFSSGNVVNDEENVPTNAKTISVPQSMAFESYASKYLNENRLLINLLTHGDTEKRLMKDGCETIQDSKPHSSERNVNTQITDNQLNLKNMETPSYCNTNAKISENSFCLDHKSSPTGVTLNSDSHSLELIATCLNLWRKQPSKPTEKKQCIELNTHRTAVGLSKAGEICDKTPVSVVGNSQNKMENCTQVTTLPMVVQNYESSSATTTKGTELQIAVVSPLISDIKTLSVKGISPDPLPETVYPVIKEGSVCSLQNQWAENTGVTAISKVSEPVTSITKSTKVFPLIQKEKQNTSINGKSEGAPDSNHGKPLVSEPDTHCPMSDQQASSNSRDSDTVSTELLQIDNICSLVEGDTSYNYQIAKIFNPPPIEKIEPQKLLPDLQVISTKKQTEQLDNITEKIELGLQEDNFLRHTDDLYKIPDQSKSTQPPQSFLKHADSSENPLESNLKHYTKEVSTAKDTCSSAALHQGGNPQEMDVSCHHTAQDPAVNEILDNTSIFPHNQLLELSKEFPYGIEPLNTHEDSPAPQITVPNSKDESCDKTSSGSKDATDQIKITILNSDEMKELFPEQNDDSPEVDKLTECEKEDPVTQKTQCDFPVHTDGSNFEMGSEKDDVRCCALGWLSNVYEGVPQCHCNSIKNLTSKVEKGKDECSLETNSCKQGENTSDKDDSIVYETSPNSNSDVALTSPIGEKRSETEQSRVMKDISKPLFSSLRTEQKLASPTLSKGVKKLDSLKCHIQKGKLKFHEVTFHSSEKRKFSEVNSQRKITGQNSSPPKAKPVFCTNKNKDLPVKKSSFVREFLPEERKLDIGDSQQKFSVKRKLGEGSILNSEIKKMKYFKQDQNKNGGVTLKTGILLNPNEGAKIKEKTVSDVKSSVSSSKDGLPRAVKVITLQQYLQRQKHKEAMGVKASKLNCEKSIPCETQSMKSNKLSVQVGSCGKSNELHSSGVQTSEESLSICSSQAKKTKIHHSNVSKSYLLGNVKETVGGKQPDKMVMDKTKLDKNSININNGVEPSHLSPQAKEQRKQYLNRVAFKCIERESICLTRLESLPKNVNKEKRVENKPLPKKNTTEKQSMLEFKLCPDGLMNKKTNSTEEHKDLQPCPRKEQAPMQVTGIKSSKEDWIKGSPEEKRIPEVNQEIDDNVLANSRNINRTFSADGLETLKNPPKDSKAIFQTYKKMYLEKRSKSLGSSPLKEF